MPSSVVLPTPEPAKMPMRWPRPQGTRPSSARTPSGSGRSIRGAERHRRRRHRRPPLRARRRSGRRPSIGWPSPSSTRPSSSVADDDAEATRRWRSRGCRGRCRRISPSGISSVRPSRKPTTSAGTGSARRPALDHAAFAHLGMEPGRLDHEPDHRQRPGRSCGRGRRRASAWNAPPALLQAHDASARAAGARGALELCLQPRVDLALVACARHSHRAPTRRSPETVIVFGPFADGSSLPSSSTLEQPRHRRGSPRARPRRRRRGAAALPRRRRAAASGSSVERGREDLLGEQQRRARRRAPRRARSRSSRARPSDEADACECDAQRLELGLGERPPRGAVPRVPAARLLRPARASSRPAAPCGCVDLARPRAPAEREGVTPLFRRPGRPRPRQRRRRG